MVACEAGPAGSSSVGAGMTRASSAEDGTTPSLNAANAARPMTASVEKTRDRTILLSFRAQERVEGVLVVGMPARQRRPILGDVARRPLDAPVVGLARHLVVGTEDIEIPLVHRLDQHVYHLVGSPGTGRLLAAAAAGHAGERRTGDQQVRGDARAFFVPQAVRQRFGQ